MNLLQTGLLFVLTALMELLGCYLPALWLQGKQGAWVLIPGALALAAFAWLLSLHPAASGRVYAAYGGVYIAMALVWLRLVDGERLHWADIAGASVALLGMVIIIAVPRH